MALSPSSLVANLWPFLMALLFAGYWLMGMVASSVYITAVLLYGLTWLWYSGPISNWFAITWVIQLLIALGSGFLGGVIGSMQGGVLAGNKRMSCFSETKKQFISMRHFSTWVCETVVITIVVVLYEITLPYTAFGEIWLGIIVEITLLLGGLFTLWNEKKISAQIMPKAYRAPVTWAFVWLHIWGIIGVAALFLNLLWRITGWMNEIWIQLIGLGLLFVLAVIVVFIVKCMQVSSAVRKKGVRLTGRDGMDDMDE